MEVIEKLKEVGKALFTMEYHDDVQTITEAIQALEAKKSDAVEFYKWVDSSDFMHLTGYTYYDKEEKNYTIDELYQLFLTTKQK